MKNFKKLFAVAASVMMLASTVPTAVLGAASYSDELQGAYDYAYGIGVTTQSSIDNANMFGTLLRSHMAKMMVNYAKEVKGLTADTSLECNFTDIANQTEEMQGYIKEACQMGLMGVGITAFNPNGVVTRAQFGTVLSRVLYGTANDGGDPYYADHLAALKDAGIMNNISNPNAPEVRGYVMLMMQRAAEGDTPAICDTPENTLSCSLGLDTCPAQCQTAVVVGDGNLAVSTSSNFSNGQSFPVAAGIKVASIKLSASSDDVVVNNITLLSKGVGSRTDIAGVALMMNGKKLTKTKAISSEDKVDLNLLSSVTIKAGSSETFDVIITTNSAVGEHYFQIAADGINSNAKDVTGLPLSTTMFKTSTTNAGQLTLTADGSLSTPKLGEKDVTVSKFKMDVDGVEDVNLNAITFKLDSTSTIQATDLENFKLYINGIKVASTDAITNKYVSFNLGSTYKLEKNKSGIRFVVTADIVGGAGKLFKFIIDSDTDIMANGTNFGYGALISGRTNVAQTSPAISAGSITITKTNAATDQVIKNKKNVEFGAFSIKSTSKDVELSNLKLTIASTNDAPVGVTFAQIENLEIYDSTNGTVYDLAYLAGNGTKTYNNTDMGLIIKAGTTHNLIVRADTKLSATNGDYTISIANASTDLTIKETVNDVLVTDITPNALSLKKVSIASAALTFSKNVLSAAYTAVVGTNDVPVLDFNVKTNLVDSVKVTELKFANVQGGAVMDNTEVAGFNLYKMVGTEWKLVKTVGTSQLANEEVTFSNLSETIPANTLQQYKLTVDFVKDTSNNTHAFKLRLSAYSAESADQGTALYDTAAETLLANGIIAAGEAGYAGLTSARVVTLSSVGTLTTDTDLADLATNKDINVVAGATTNFVAAYKMEVANEPVKIKDFSIVASANPSASVSKIQIYGTDKVTLIAEMPVTAQTTAFTNVSGFIMPVGTNNVYMKLVTRAIGKDLPGAQATDLTFTFDGVTVEGNNSGDPITATDTATASKKVSINPVKVSAVTFVNSYDGQTVDTALTNGANVIGILAVTAEANANVDSVTAQALKTKLTSLDLTLALASATVGYTAATIERIGGTDAAVASTQNGTLYNFALSTMTNDNLIPAGQTYYYKIVATVGGLSNTTVGSLQAKIAHPDSGDLTYDDNDTAASYTAVTALRLGVSTITALKINQN